MRVYNPDHPCLSVDIDFTSPQWPPEVARANGYFPLEELTIEQLRTIVSTLVGVLVRRNLLQLKEPDEESDASQNEPKLADLLGSMPSATLGNDED